MPMASLGSQTIPAGSSITINLVNGDQNVIQEVTFTASIGADADNPKVF
jgi:hypothetical protein